MNFMFSNVVYNVSYKNRGHLLKYKKMSPIKKIEYEIDILHFRLLQNKN